MIKNIWKGFYYLLIVVIALVAIFLVLSVFPTKSGYGTFVVLSGSMEPKIKTGSVVAIKSEESYQKGDVITFGENTKIKKPTTHRIVEVKDSKSGKTYVTKGDANNSNDQSPVKESEVLGKVFLSIPYVGYAVSAAQKPIGFMLIIVVPAVIIIYDELQNIKNEIKKKIDYKKRMKKCKENQESDKDSNKDDAKKEQDDHKKENDEKKEV